MAPDAIEYGFFRTGVRREGIYFSVWTFVIALGGALAGFLVGQGLNLFAYVPNVAQTATSVLGIRLLIGPLPALLILLGNLAMFFYPLDKKRYEAMLLGLREQKAVLAVVSE
jgi:GPH family glycoside/pentoside/hexuronide:cation symporter